jgi:flagellar hook-basal body complex protein FliE
MDGLTIGNSNRMLETGSTLKEIRDSKLQTPAPAAPGSSEGAKSFGQILSDSIQSVNAAQKESDTKMNELAVGKNQNIPEIMISAEKADIQLRLMVQVRNKIIEAYQEIMKMQV